MTIRIHCLLIIGVLIGRAAGFSINKKAVIVIRDNNANIPRQIIDLKDASSFPSFTMMSTADDEAEMIEDNTDAKKTVEKSVQAFMFGANYVHTNYLDTWGMIMRRGKLLLPLAAFLFIGVAVLPNSCAHFVSEHLRTVLERGLLLFHSTPIRLLLASMHLPYMIVRGIINGGLRSYSDITAFITRIFHRIVINTPKAFHCRPSISDAIVVAPIVEELVFRWGLWRLWEMFLSIKGNKKQSPDNSDSDDSRSLSRWVIVSSLLFSAAHIGNHLPVPSVDEVTLSFPRKDIEDILSKQLFDQHTRDLFMSFAHGLHEYQMRFRPIISTMFQCQLAYVLGSSLLCPLFLRHGFWAAVGAHFTWNVCACTLPFQIPLRLLIRMIRNAKEQREMKKTQDN